MAGDRPSACAEFSELAPSAVTVAVKQALGQAAAVTVHPQEARKRLRRAAADAITRRASIPPPKIAGPLDVEVDLYGPYTVDLAVLVPGVTRVGGGRTVAFHAADFADAYRLVQLLVQLAAIKPG
ncbi:M55 family metallopeptidase [Micromonospora sp. DT41]|uniref:M55 family metallopeptidase n=1 Tax=Micromonospora sp. DT41 TaxID=3393437 RepID=UPI003CEDA9C5